MTFIEVFLTIGLLLLAGIVTGVVKISFSVGTKKKIVDAALNRPSHEATGPKPNPKHPPTGGSNVMPPQEPKADLSGYITREEFLRYQRNVSASMTSEDFFEYQKDVKTYYSIVEKWQKELRSLQGKQGDKIARLEALVNDMPEPVVISIYGIQPDNPTPFDIYHSCKRKTRFDTKELADNFAKAKPSGDFFSYRCKYCQGYHLATRKGQ